MSDYSAVAPTSVVYPDSPDETPFTPSLYSEGTALSQLLSAINARATSSIFAPLVLIYGRAKGVSLVQGNKIAPFYLKQLGTSSAIEFDVALASLTEQGYKITNSLSVKAILQEYKFLSPLLKEAKGVLVGFYPEASYRLEPKKLHNGTPAIVLFIETSGGADSAYEQREQFLDTWWLPNLSRAQGKLSIILDFV